MTGIITYGIRCAHVTEGKVLVQMLILQVYKGKFRSPRMFTVVSINEQQVATENIAPRPTDLQASLLRKLTTGLAGGQSLAQ